MKTLLVTLAFLPTLTAFGQLPNGSQAPDFTLTDYYGTTHNLYGYLSSGKTVFVEIFAAHCPSCWAYHQTHRLKNIYDQYGPNGTDELMVLALEYDEYNDSNAFTGNHDPWVTAGDWLTGTPYPIFNVEYPDRGVFVDYDVSFYPVIYKVCPDGIVERVFTNQSEAVLYQKVQDCQAALSIDEEVDLGNVRIDPSSGDLIIDRYEKVLGVEVISVQGRTVKRTGAMDRSIIELGELRTGIYLFRIRTAKGTVVIRRYLD